MTDSKHATATDQSPGPAEQKKRIWDTVLTATPVVLTVLATLLAGQSSTQMSLAQYHRALAAQHQAKVADQWGFFQAKRIRGENFEATADLMSLLGERAPVAAERALDVADRLVLFLRRAEDDARRLTEELRDAPDELAVSALTLHEPSHRLLEAAQAAAAAAEESNRTIREAVLAETGEIKPQMASALRYLNPPFPRFAHGAFHDPDLQQELQRLRVKLKPGGSPQTSPDPALQRVLAAVREGRTDEAMTAAAAITPRTLNNAITAAADDAAVFDEWAETTAAAIRGIGSFATELVASANTVGRAADEIAAAAENMPAADSKLRAITEAILRRAGSRDTAAADQMARDVAAGRHAFTAWRYEVEARHNQRLAELYEVRVRQSSINSEGYLKRSWGYFYAQLTVQAAVTIATLGLAVRQKSVLWTIACLASAVALVYAVAVLLNAAPVPGA